ncbi:unnamed protein product, partial [Brenthis ino]
MAPPTKNVRAKTTPRPSTVNVPSTSRKAVPSKDKVVARAKVNKNTTVIGSSDITICKSEGSMPDFDAEYRQIAYGKFLRAMLEDCLVEEKIEREETQMDIQMAQLGNRFQKTMDILDKTNRRLKDISFVVEQKRLLNLKNQDCSTFYNMADNSSVEDILNNLKITEESCLDKLETKNVDFGYNNESGHRQLLDAVNEAIEGLEQIKKHSNLDIDKFKEYEKSHVNLNDIEKDRFDLESLKSELEMKFPKFSEKLLKEVSEKIASVMDNDDE